MCRLFDWTNCCGFPLQLAARMVSLGFQWPAGLGRLKDMEVQELARDLEFGPRRQEMFYRLHRKFAQWRKEELDSRALHIPPPGPHEDPNRRYRSSGRMSIMGKE